MASENPGERAGESQRSVEFARAGDAVGHAAPRSSEETVRVHRAPKYGVFAALGAMVGIVAAMILSTVFDGTDEPSRYTELEYTTSQAFGFILLWCVPAGILLGMLVALLLDRLVGRKTREIRVVHEISDED